MAAKSFGGRMRLTVAGAPVTMRGTFKLDGSNVELADGTNQNGSAYQTLKPNAYGADLTLEVDDTVSADDLVRAKGTFVIVEDDLGVTHTFTDGFFSGKYMEDRETGEISGLQIRSSGYTKKVS